jgi:uncharacterized membrane protein
MLQRRHAYIAILAGLVAAFVMHERIIELGWRYFWGPVVADAQNQATATYDGIVARSGYNTVNTTAYVLILLGFLAAGRGVLERIDISIDDELILRLTPFIIVGGLLRVVEDLGTVPYPYNTVLITPSIYFLMAGLVLLLVYASYRAEEQGYTLHYSRPLLGAGTILVAILLGLLAYHGIRHGMSPGADLLIPVSSTVLAASYLVARYLGRYRPSSYLNTTPGILAVLGQALDGSATAVSIGFLGYGEKHVLSSAVIDGLQRLDLTATGLEGPFGFMLLKISLIIGFMGWIGQDESDDLTMLLLLAIIIVGIAPGTRNLVRALLSV